MPVGSGGQAGVADGCNQLTSLPLHHRMPALWRAFWVRQGACALIARVGLGMAAIVEGRWARPSRRRSRALLHAAWAVGCLTAVATLLAVSGCRSIWNAWLSPSEVGRFGTSPRSMEIRGTLTFQDDPLGLPGAMEPTPEDLVAFVGEYKVGAGDVLLLETRDLLQPNLRSQDLLVVNDVGYVRVPVAGAVKVEGLSASEIEEAISERLISEMVLREPTVTVTVQQRTAATFSLLGRVTRPGRYPIPRPDFRLLDAIAMAGDVAEGTIYVIRPGPLPRQMIPGVEERYERKLERRKEEMPGMGPDQFPIEPMTEPVRPFPPLEEDEGGLDFQPAPAFMPSDVGPFQPAPPATQPVRDEELRELMEALGTQPAQARPSTAPTTEAAAQPETGPVRLEGEEWMVVPPPAPATEPAARPTTEQVPTLPPEAWEALAQPEEGQARIISIPVDLLKQGEARYNIVIRPGDILRVPATNYGEFYMMGHVNRPGVYSLAGREITLMQGIAAAGGLGGLAWPSRVEIVRRFGDNREEIVPVNVDKIFAGEAPDVFLRAHDLVHVGTHPVAPFMAVIRNAFRFSYGVSFVYDRNFGDIDAYSQKVNPDSVRRQREQQQTARGSLSLGGLRP